MTLSFFSLVTSPAEIISTTETILGCATCFFYKQDERYIYLVTNWHVVTGRNPMAPNISNSGAIPTHLRLRLHKNVGDGKISLSQKLLCLFNINDQDGNSPKWLEHPKHRYNIDVVVLRIEKESSFMSNVFFRCISEYSHFEERYAESAMDDIIVIGYPWGLDGGDRVLPLFKRGSIASEPTIDYNGLPQFLIDCKTTKGMSGAPVICLHKGIWSPTEKESDAVVGTVEKFSGIYSGRWHAKEFGEHTKATDEITEIGIVWKKAVIEEIIQGGVFGTEICKL
ncbi:MAG: trypsin-like peptidase domain-containing protein [Rhodospirillales bacterium]|nr:trypsin-like peptidase domain-containing protein [Rhodospirillales bacterium]